MGKRLQFWQISYTANGENIQLFWKFKHVPKKLLTSDFEVWAWALKNLKTSGSCRLRAVGFFKLRARVRSGLLKKCFSRIRLSGYPNHALINVLETQVLILKWVLLLLHTYFYFFDDYIRYYMILHLLIWLKLDYLGDFPWESNTYCHENKAQLVCFKHSFELIWLSLWKEECT